MSNETSPQLKHLVRRLLAHEKGYARGPKFGTERTFGVIERLRKPLVVLTGIGGFRSVLSRALALANADVLWLKALHIKGDGNIEGLNDVSCEVSYEDVVEGETALLIHFITSLITFIGPTMTLELLQAVWPKMTRIDFE